MIPKRELKYIAVSKYLLKLKCCEEIKDYQFDTQVIQNVLALVITELKDKKEESNIAEWMKQSKINKEELIREITQYLFDESNNFEDNNEEENDFFFRSDI